MVAVVQEVVQKTHPCVLVAFSAFEDGVALVHFVDVALSLPVLKQNWSLINHEEGNKGDQYLSCHIVSPVS